MPDVPKLLRDQFGVVARWQLDDRAAVDQVRRRVKSGRWRAPYRGVYVEHSGPLSAAQRTWSALLLCGPGAALSGLTAAAASGLVGFEDTTIHIAVPRERRGASVRGIEVRRLRRLDSLVHPVLSPRRLRLADAMVDAAATSRPDDAHALLCAAVQQGLLLATALEEALARRSPLPQAGLIQESLLDISDGCQSLNEIAFVRNIAEAGLPRPMLQVHAATPGRRSYIDGGWPEYDVWYEIDGELHRAAASWIADLDRANELAIEHGGVRLRWPGFVVRRDPERVVAQVRRALARTGGPVLGTR